VGATAGVSTIDPCGATAPVAKADKTLRREAAAPTQRPAPPPSFPANAGESIFDLGAWHFVQALIGQPKNEIPAFARIDGRSGDLTGL